MLVHVLKVMAFSCSYGKGCFVEICTDLYGF